MTLRHSVIAQIQGTELNLMFLIKRAHKTNLWCAEMKTECAQIHVIEIAASLVGEGYRVSLFAFSFSSYKQGLSLFAFSFSSYKQRLSLCLFFLFL
jgi:hypothetical protein